MGVRALVVLTLVGGILGLGGPVSGAMIYMTAASDAGEAGAVTAAAGLLTGLGATVTVGVTPANFDGTVDLAPYDAVVLNVGAAAAVTAIPTAGEQSLVDFVNAGGGLITCEWLIWNTGGNTVLAAILPAIKGGSTASSAQTYVPVTPDPVINDGLAGNVVFTATNNGGSGTRLAARPGATTFYNGSPTGAGLVGWQYGSGKVVSFNCVIGNETMADTDFQTLFGNATEWVLPAGVVIPEPGTLALLALAGVGVLLKRKR